MTKALVLLSGGLDSTTCLTMAVANHGPAQVETISMFYGQKHELELKSAASVAHHFEVPWHILNLPDIFGRAGSTLVKGGPDNPKGTYADLPEGPSPTYVPFRNGNLLSAATAYAVGLQAAEIWFGAHAEDAENWAYPDCTPEFIGAMANAIYIGSYKKIRLVTPLEWMTKADVVRTGLALDAPYELTLSCYNGKQPACGECPTCKSRLAAFAENGAVDPIMYAQLR